MAWGFADAGQHTDLPPLPHGIAWRWLPCVRRAKIGHNQGMGNPLIDLVVAILALCGAIGVVGMLRTTSLYDRIGEGGTSSTAGGAPEPVPGSPAAIAERDMEIRQMLQARSDRRVARGEAPLDLDAELSRLTVEPTGDRSAARDAHRRDPELVEELRQLAEARNQRRLRRGETPLDVRAEVERALSELDV